MWATCYRYLETVSNVGITLNIEERMLRKSSNIHQKNMTNDKLHHGGHILEAARKVGENIGHVN